MALSSAFHQIQGSPLFLNQGGVFQSPAARQHFESQFGLGFFSQLAAAQRAAVGFGPVAPVAPVTPAAPTAAPTVAPSITVKTAEDETPADAADNTDKTASVPSTHQPRVVVRKGRRRQQNQQPAQQISATALQQIQQFQQAQLLQQQLLLLRGQQQQLQQQQIAQTPIFFDSSFQRFQNPLLSQQQQINFDLDNSV